MKINIVFPYNTWGGAFRSTYELSNRMIKKGYSSDLLSNLPLLSGKAYLVFQDLSCLYGFIRSLVRGIRYHGLIWCSS